MNKNTTTIKKLIMIFIIILIVLYILKLNSNHNSRLLNILTKQNNVTIKQNNVTINNNSKILLPQDTVYYKVNFENNIITITIYLNKNYDSNWHISIPYSNAKQYIDFFELYDIDDKKIIIKNINNSIQINSSIKKIKYRINDSIYWSINSPYAKISNESLIVESIFLFLREENKNIDHNNEYKIKFYNENNTLNLFNSLSGFNSEFNLNEEEIFQSFFYIGKSENCSKRINKYTINIIFANKINETYCKNQFSIIKEYFRLFENPIQMNENYTIIISNASIFSAKPSGFFINKPSISYTIHELTHMWQPVKNNCKNIFFMTEGLNNYLLWKIQSELNIIPKEQFEQIFNDINITSEKYQDYTEYLLDKDKLEIFRKDNPAKFNILAYYYTAAIWKIAEDNGINATNEFQNLIKTNNCSKIDDIFEKYAHINQIENETTK